LEVVLLLVTVRFAESVNGTAPFRPFMTLSVAILLPFIVTGLDQLYLNTILRYTDPICMSLPFLYTTAEWLSSPNGGSYLATTLSTTSEATLVAIVFEVVCIFLLSRIFGKHRDTDHLVTA
jgi:hypothetical protein